MKNTDLLCSCLICQCLCVVLNNLTSFSVTKISVGTANKLYWLTDTSLCEKALCSLSVWTRSVIMSSIMRVPHLFCMYRMHQVMKSELYTGPISACKSLQVHQCVCLAKARGSSDTEYSDIGTQATAVSNHVNLSMHV